MTIIYYDNNKVYYYHNKLLPLSNMIESVGVGGCSIHLFVHSIIKKRTIPKCSHMVYGMILGYHKNNVVFGPESSNVKARGSISAFFTL